MEKNIDQLAEFKRIRINNAMDEYKIDLLIGSTIENIFYMTEYTVMSSYLLHKTQSYVLYKKHQKECSLVIPYAEIASAYESLGRIRYYVYGGFRFDYLNKDTNEINIVKEYEEKSFSSAENALIKAIRDSEIQEGRIGLDENKVSIQTWQLLVSTFPNIEFVPASLVFGKARMIKHIYEIQYLGKAVEIAEKALSILVGKISIGMTEKEMEKIFMTEVCSLGGKPLFNVLTSDHRSAYVDTINSNKKIVDGSWIRIDFGCDYKGYKSDISRTIAIGNYDKKIKQFYSAIRHGQELAIKAIKPGVTCEEIFNIAVEGTKEDIPNYRRHHCGHGIGLEIYDSPSIAPGVKEILKPGMVLCIETPYYIVGWGGVQVEDTIEVTTTGYRFLNKTNRDLIEVL